jgi:carbonic anhydrase
MMKKIVTRSLIVAGLVSFLTLSSFASALPNIEHSKEHKAHWSYDGATSPEHWSELEDNFASCKIGEAQSPIDLVEEDAQVGDLNKIETFYKDVKLKITNNGHTIQVDYPKGSYAMFDGKRYDLVQFHFHTPSEHTFSGNAKPMEIHLVHKSTEGEIAVLGVLLDIKENNKFLAKFWDKLPKEGVTKEYDTIINVKDILPKSKEYYHYSGSLTTPPCSEGVDWNVMKELSYVSKEQVEKFKSFFNHNARPIQPLKGRVVETSE